jgi:hypothetical protein
MAVYYKGECIGEDGSYALPWNLDDCRDCVRGKLNRDKTYQENKKGHHDDAIGMLGDAQDWFDTGDALVRTSFELEFAGGADIGATLSPFSGVQISGLTAGVKADAVLGGRFKIDLKPNRKVDGGTVTVFGDAGVSASLYGNETAARTGFQVVTVLDFKNGEYQKVGSSTLTLYFDVWGTLGAPPVYAGAGQKVSVDIDLAQIDDNFTAALERFVEGDFDPLINELADLDATFKSQGRRSMVSRLVARSAWRW